MNCAWPIVKKKAQKEGPPLVEKSSVRPQLLANLKVFDGLEHKEVLGIS